MIRAAGTGFVLSTACSGLLTVSSARKKDAQRVVFVIYGVGRKTAETESIQMFPNAVHHRPEPLC